ncbi:MAG: hypothetical protein WCS52_02350 [bacterium]
MLLIVGGCATSPVLPPRWQLTAPQAASAQSSEEVYLGKVYKSYVIKFIASTNACADPDISADMATNRLPARRFHIDLSIDGGSNWIRRIGYGVQADASMVQAELQWSPPADYSLLTTSAMVRATNLDGQPWPTRTPARPYDLPAGKYPVSFTFPIVGATITTPAAGSIQWRGEGVDMSWRQSGGGAVWDLYWITPDSKGVDFSHWITTISNVVEGVNSKRISLNAPVADQLQLYIMSQSDPNLIGVSPIFTVDP